LFLPVVAITLWSAGCSNAIEPKECDKLRGAAFDLLNEAHHCNSDADCRLSEWPGCDKPVSSDNYAKIKASRDKFTAGECAEPEQKCREAPVAYCKQGLCTFREQGNVAGVQPSAPAGEAP
jgi:hypothetical protein